MNYSIILFTVLVLFSCNIASKSDDEGNSATETIPKSKSDSTSYNTNKLFGEWGIYVTISGGVETVCNACPKIIFNTDYTASIIKPSASEQSEIGTWIINNNTLTFLNKDMVRNDSTFSDTSYEMMFIQKKEFVELKLTQKEEKYSYLLRR